MLLFAMFVMLAFSDSTLADPCPAACRVPDLRDYRDLIHKAGYFEDEDERRSEGQYAKENGTDPNRFAATGQMVCKDASRTKEVSLGTANLVLKSNMIVTAAHVLQDAKSCVKLADATDCVFRVRLADGVHEEPIEKKMFSGFDGNSCPQRLVDDFVILKLAKPIVGVKFYTVDLDAVKSLKQGSGVAFAGYSVDRRYIDTVNGKTVFQFPKHVGNCSVMKPPTYKIWASCASSNFSSGGGLVSRDTKEPILLGILTANSMSDPDSQSEWKTGVPIHSPGSHSEFLPFQEGQPLYRELMRAAAQL